MSPVVSYTTTDPRTLADTVYAKARGEPAEGSENYQNPGDETASSEMVVVPYTTKDIKILANTVYAEARGEPREGQIAVTWVIINRARANKPEWGGSSIRSVCRHPNQFECWNGVDQIDVHEPDVHIRITTLVIEVLKGRQPNPTGGCDHYNNPDKETSSWVNNVSDMTNIGSHHFYKCRG